MHSMTTHISAKSLLNESEKDFKVIKKKKEMNRLKEETTAMKKVYKIPEDS